MLSHFAELVEKQGRTYYPVVPWDYRNLQELKEYYDPPFIAELMDMYIRSKSGGWTVKDFCYAVPQLAQRYQTDKASLEHIKKLKEETANRMREAGRLRES